jgi:hypothetical protein
MQEIGGISRSGCETGLEKGVLLSAEGSLKCREFGPTLPEVLGKSPPICDFLPINRTGENVRLLPSCVYSPHFLCSASWWSGFAILGWRK